MKPSRKDQPARHAGAHLRTGGGRADSLFRLSLRALPAEPLV